MGRVGQTMRKRRGCSTVATVALGWLLAIAPAVRAQDEDGGFLGLNDVDLSVASESGDFLLTFSGILDLEYYHVDDEAPGLIFTDDPFFTQRLMLFADAEYGDHWRLFVQGRADRGFDPSDKPVQVRADEYFLRYTEPGDDWSASAQVGKFATPLGNFVPRHDSFRNPLVRAPLPYDFMTSIGDKGVPANNQAQIDRRDIEDKKGLWLTPIWGPVYHTGAMVFGTWRDFDLRFAVTNAAPSERPDEWMWQNGDIDNLAFSARAGWRAFPGFVAGINWARGPYFRHEAHDSLPRGAHRHDFDQKLVGIDLEYRIGHFEFFAEIYGSEWEVPNTAGDFRSVSYYVEGKYTVTPRLHVATRWGQIFFNEVRDRTGARTEWDRDSWRAELGVGYLFESNLLGKVQYEVNEHQGGREPHDNMLSLSMSLSF